ncbi:unnamed protein product [Fusarium equiseti]|uniref:Uncharacterized protein n=1 Tax=Fusarium equiseti TaxID=61235 RepID=A0A8J2IRK7_FUSEQ|nr:unnamed protein product [Fusarium equiseti]
MAPPPCIISYASDPEKEARKEETGARLTFSHEHYMRLYYKFIHEREVKGEAEFSYEKDILSNVVSITTTKNLSLQADYSIFNNKPDALRWKRLVPFCLAVGPSELSRARKELGIKEGPWLLKVRKELDAEDFRKTLKVSDWDWESEWGDATPVEAPRVSAKEVKSALKRRLSQVKKLFPSRKKES